MLPVSPSCPPAKWNEFWIKGQIDPRVYATIQGQEPKKPGQWSNYRRKKVMK